MFDRHEKKRRASYSRPLKDLIRMVSMESVLTDEKRGQLIQQIKSGCALDTTRFESLCTVLIHNITNHCQNLPETSNSYYSHSGGLIDHALNRSEAALNLFRQYLILEQQADFSEEQKLWQYALLSASLLQGIGKLQTDYSVELFDCNGTFLKQWNPLLENLVATGSYYLYSFQKESDRDFRCRLNILLASQLMPASGFAWIASNPQVLEIWLALLNEDYQAAGTLGSILVRADGIAIQRYFNQLILKNYGNRKPRYAPGTFSGGTPAEFSNKDEQVLGVEFLQWLSKTLESGKNVINRLPLLVVPGGLLMCIEIFNMYVKDTGESRSWKAVRNSFLALGLHKNAPDGAAISLFEQQKTGKTHQGIIFEHYNAALPSEVPVSNPFTDKVTMVSATELTHLASFQNLFVQQGLSAEIGNSLPFLTASGQWLQQNNKNPEIFTAPGSTQNV